MSLENTPDSSGNEPERHSLESTVNTEGLDSLFLFARMHHPVIRRQVVDLIEEAEQSRREEVVT